MFVLFDGPVQKKTKKNLNRIKRLLLLAASWSKGNAFISGAEGLRFKSRAV